MKSIGKPAPLKGATATEILRAVPYVRGCKMAAKPVRWTTVGTGVVHELVEEYADKVSSSGSIEEQWEQWEEILRNEDAEDILAPKIKNYVAYVRNTNFDWFECPTCKELI